MPPPAAPIPAPDRWPTDSGAFVRLRFVCTHAHAFGEITIKIVSRLMGLILIAIAVQFLLDGIRESGIFAAA